MVVVRLARGEFGVEVGEKYAKGMRFWSVPNGFSEFTPESNSSGPGFLVPGVRGMRTSDIKSAPCGVDTQYEVPWPHAVTCK